MAIVAFLDVLGTKEAVMSGRFSDIQALDFVGPAGVAASFFKDLRFAVFSDSIVISAAEGCETQLVQALSMMYGNWFSDFVLVRGGIAIGDICWVDQPGVDERFRRLRNLSFARLYGSGLVRAYEIEERSGPGAICYLSESAAGTLSDRISGDVVLPGVTPMLCWAVERQAKRLERYSITGVESAAPEGAERRHAIATHAYWTQVIANRKYLSDHLQVIPSLP